MRYVPPTGPARPTPPDRQRAAKKKVIPPSVLRIFKPGVPKKSPPPAPFRPGPLLGGAFLPSPLVAQPVKAATPKPVTKKAAVPRIVTPADRQNLSPHPAPPTHPGRPTHPTKTGPPVAGGSGAPGTGAPSAGSALDPTLPAQGGTTGGTGTAAGKTSTVEQLFGPVFQQIKDQRTAAAAQQAKASANLDSFRAWQAAQLQSGQDFYANQMGPAQQATSDALKGITANIGQYSTGAYNGLGPESGLGTSAAVQALQQSSLATGGALSQNVQAAIAARLADNPKIVSATAGGMLQNTNARFAKRFQDLSTQEQAYTLDQAKAKLQEQQSARSAANDRITAQSLSGQRVFDNTLAVAKLDQGAKTDAARLAEDKRLNDSRIALNKSKARKSQLGTSAKPVYTKLFNTAIKQRDTRKQWELATPEERPRIIAQAKQILDHIALADGTPPQFVQWALYDAFGQAAVQAAQAAGAAARAAAGG